MSIEFDEKLAGFDRWYRTHRKCERDTGKELRFLQEAIDRAIKLIEQANKDLRAYEKRNISPLLHHTGIIRV